MDPEEQIAVGILTDNSLNFRHLQRLSGGFRNVVFQVDDRYVLRFDRHPAYHDCMRRECELQQKVRGVAPIPELLRFGISRDNAAYQLWEFVAGERLADIWTVLDSVGQIRLVDQLCAILEKVHAIKCEDYGAICTLPHGFPTWIEYARAELADYPFEPSVSSWARRVDELRLEIADRITNCQPQEGPVLIHNDVVMTNIIVKGTRIAALIDWELAMKAPLDHEVYKLEWFCRDPGVVGISGDFHRLWELMALRYPAMFLHRNLIERLDSYDLLAAWRMFRYQVRVGHSLETMACQFIQRARDILKGAVTRLTVPGN